MQISFLIKTSLLAASCAASLAACKGPDSDKADNAAIVTATETPSEISSDPNAINAPIPAKAFKLDLSVVSEPTLAADGRSVTYQVKVDNNGTATVYGVGKNKVNIGVMILGDDGTTKGSGGVRDFVRTALPLIPSGQSATVSVGIPVDPRLDGRSLRIATVQENVTWHEENPIDVGPFKLEGEVFASLPSSK